MLLVPNNSSVKTIRLVARDGCSTATFLPEYGGVLASLCLPGAAGLRECLYRQANFWEMPRDDLAGGMPFVFPAFGRLECQGQAGYYQHAGQSYALPIHGFAWQQVWTVQAQTADRLVLSLTASPATLAGYPFAFAVRLAYHLQPGRLWCVQTYHNPGQQALPYSAGFHPYFATPFAGQGKEQVQLEFVAQRHYRYNARFTDLIADEAPLSMPRLLGDPALQDLLSRLAPRQRVVLRFPAGDRLSVCASGVEDAQMFSFLQLYTRDDQPFFCAEPLTSPPNSLNSGIALRWLAPGQTERAVLSIALHKNHDT